MLIKEINNLKIQSKSKIKKVFFNFPKKNKISFVRFESKSLPFGKKRLYKKEELDTLRTSILALQLFKLNLTNQ